MGGRAMTTPRFAFGFTLLILGCFAFDSSSIEQSPAAETSTLQLRISTEQTKYRISETISLRIEIDNLSTQDVFIGTSLINYTNAPSSLILNVKDRNGNAYPDAEMSGSHIQSAFSEWWTRVSVLSFYGINQQINVTSHPFLAKAGKYRISAKYVSKGGKTPANVEWHIPSYSVWAGEIESNTIEIEVLPR
jgi:hypothetical protein